MSLASEKSGVSKKWLPGVIVSALIILVFAWVIDWKTFIGAIREINPWVLVGLAVLTTLALGTRSTAWRSLLNQRIAIREAFWAENIGYLINNLLPFRLGEVARATLFIDRVDGGFAAILPSIFLERLIDLCFGVITLLIAIPFVVSAQWMLPAIFTSIGVIVAATFFLIYSGKKPEVIERWIIKLFAKMPGVQQSLLRLFRQFLDGLHLATQGKNFIRAILFLAITWLFYWLSYYLLIWSIEPQAKFFWALFTDGVVSLGIAIPSAPGSLGVWEASFVAALAVFGIEQSRSLAIAVVMHLINYLITGFFGIIGFNVLGSSFQVVLRQIQDYRTRNSNIISGGEL